MSFKSNHFLGLILGTNKRPLSLKEVKEVRWVVGWVVVL
jgi:hypothetical protein